MSEKTMHVAAIPGDGVAHGVIPLAAEVVQGTGPREG